MMYPSVMLQYTEHYLKIDSTVYLISVFWDKTLILLIININFIK